MLNINHFRNKEYLDEDNKHKREVIRRITKSVSKYPAEIASASGEISPNDKLSLNRLIQSFLNSLDDNMMNYYKDDDKPMASDELLKRWNNLIIFYNTNIDRTFKYILDSKLQTNDVSDKMAIIVEMARTNTWNDYLELVKLQQYLQQGKYEIIQHMVFSTGSTPQNIQRETFEKKDVAELKRKVRKDAKAQQPTLTTKELDKLAKNMTQDIINNNTTTQEIIDVKKQYGIPTQLDVQTLTPYERKRLNP